MKAQLKHIEGQYILIVDERPKIGDWFYIYDSVYKIVDKHIPETDKYCNDCFKIIASETLEGVKGIRFDARKYKLQPLVQRFSDLIKPYIDTEVEVEEHEDYYLVKL